MNWSSVFKQRFYDWSLQWIKKASEANQSIYTEQSSVDIMREVFGYMMEDVWAGLVNDEILTMYCLETMFYCDFSNDWRDWPKWAERIIDKVGVEDRVKVLYGLSRYRSESGQYEMALLGHDEGINLLATVDDPSVDRSFWEGVHCTGQAIALQRMNQFERAKECSIRSVQLFSSIGHKYRISHALANLASNYDRQGDRVSAIRTYNEAIELLVEIENKYELGQLSYDIGISYLFANHLGEAFDAFQASMALCRETGNTYHLALAYYGMAMLLYRLGDYHNSHEYIEKSFRVFEQTTRSGRVLFDLSFPQSQGNLHNFAGALMVRLGEFDQAFAYLAKADEFYDEVDNSRILKTKVLANRARAFELSGHLAEAKESFSRLFLEAKELQIFDLAGGAGVHLLRIYQRENAGYREWLKLMQFLGGYGIRGIVKEQLERKRRDIEIRNVKKLRHT